MSSKCTYLGLMAQQVKSVWLKMFCPACGDGDAAQWYHSSDGVAMKIDISGDCFHDPGKCHSLPFVSFV